MSRVKIFYSYAHEDESHREELEKYLSVLRKKGKISEWYDRKIMPGSNFEMEVDREMENAHVILLLFSQDFIDSEACKKETELALKLRKDRDVKVVFVIVRPCSWSDFVGEENAKLLAVPKDAKAVSTWKNKDKAWLCVYDELKSLVEKVEKQFAPQIKGGFKDELLTNPVAGSTLEKLFVYPDLAESSVESDLEGTAVDSEQLENIEEFDHSYVLIDGEEQSGKTSLCHMLFLKYTERGFYPIKIRGGDVGSKFNISEIASKNYKQQYDNSQGYTSIDKEKIILLFDDIDKCKFKESDDFKMFVLSIADSFSRAVVFIDQVSNLSDKSSRQDYFPSFHHLSITPFGYQKRSELIKKCISLDEGLEFDMGNISHVERLDKNTNHIDSIIRGNVVPSYPVFIVTILNAVESAIKQDFSQTSYGHCYQAMITMQLTNIGIKGEDIDSYFNFLTRFAYLMFENQSESISEDELEQFLQTYEDSFIVQDRVIHKLVDARIVKTDNGYRFGYVYIYYYFVARYITQNLNNERIKKQIDKLMSSIDLKESANIIIFITHHTRDKGVLENIILNAMGVFIDFPVATLSGEEKDFLGKIQEKLGTVRLPDPAHDVEEERRDALERKDKVRPIIEKKEDLSEQEVSTSLSIEIKRAAKSIEIIGQILKNQYGSLEKSMLENLFEEGQDVGLRLMKSFMDLMLSEQSELKEIVASHLEKTDKKLSKEEIDEMSQKVLSFFSYSIILGWMDKIVSSLGYDKIVDIADEVNSRKETVASELINFSIHAWHTKKVDVEKIKALRNKFKNEGNHQAIYILTDIVAHHLHMHTVDFSEKQKLKEALGFSVKSQLSLQDRGQSSSQKRAKGKKGKR